MGVETPYTYPEDARAVLDFWFHALKPEDWWTRDETVDANIISCFSSLYERLAEEVPGEWLATPGGRLAAIIVLDQFPRNMFRDDSRAFASDARALEIAGQTVAAGEDEKLGQYERGVLYMPYQHSEDSAMQARSVELFTALGDAAQLDFAIKHKQVIDRFGRFPHRNKILGRESSAEEVVFLNQPGLFW
jgi:uncharacterized protein (DUF924 family)